MAEKKRGHQWLLNSVLHFANERKKRGVDCDKILAISLAGEKDVKMGGEETLGLPLLLADISKISPLMGPGGTSVTWKKRDYPGWREIRLKEIPGMTIPFLFLSFFFQICICEEGEMTEPVSLRLFRGRRKMIVVGPPSSALSPQPLIVNWREHPISPGWRKSVFLFQRSLLFL